MSLIEANISRLLLCSSDKGKLEPLRLRLKGAGVEVDCVTQAEEARQLMWEQHYDAVALDLLMADRDGISFALELRQEHPWLSILVISTTQNSERMNSGPDWLRRSADYARLIFALKQAGQRSAGRAPKILHVEDDDGVAELVKNTIGKQTQLFRARSTQEAQIAMALRNYDLALIRTQIPETQASWNGKLGEQKALQVSTDRTSDPVLTILNNLRRSPYVHQPAYC